MGGWLSGWVAVMRARAHTHTTAVRLSHERLAGPTPRNSPRHAPYVHLYYYIILLYYFLEISLGIKGVVFGLKTIIIYIVR